MFRFRQWGDHERTCLRVDRRNNMAGASLDKFADRARLRELELLMKLELICAKL